MEPAPLSSLNSILELLTAFNFAFVASNAFLNDLNLKLTSSFGEVKSAMKNIKTRINEVEEFLAKELNSEGDRSALSDRRKELDSIISKKEEYKTEIKSSIQKLSASDVFQRFCLFGGIYCLAVLLIAVYEDFLVVDLFEEFLITFNIFSIVYLTWMNWPNKLKIKYPREPIIWDIMLTFVFGVVFSLVLLLLFEGWLKLHCPYDLNWIMKLTTVMLPSAHYLYYFTRALLRSKHMGRRKLHDCNNVLQEINNLNIRLQGNVDVYNR